MIRTTTAQITQSSGSGSAKADRKGGREGGREEELWVCPTAYLPLQEEQEGEVDDDGAANPTATYHHHQRNSRCEVVSTSAGFVHRS